MHEDIDHRVLLRPIETTSRRYFVLLAVVLLAILSFVIAYAYQLQHGLIVTGLADWGSGGGATWGLYIGAFIWWVGIAHGGIILSAAVRLLGMERYKPVARIAELLTIGALSMAGLMIVVHLGRPDRFVTNIILAYPETVHTSPLVWDVTVITLYFVLTATYLGLTLRYDIVRLRDELPDRFDPLYRLLTVGYRESEDPVVERMVWWLALGIIILAPLLLHGGVIPWLFALLPSMPGWFSAVQGPQFLTIALTSAIGSVLVISLAFRRAYDWGALIGDDVFRGLGLWLGLFALLFLWLQLQQVITGVFAPPIDVDAATSAKLSSPIYWLAIVMIVTALGYLTAQAIEPRYFTIPRTVFAGVLVVSATLIEKTFFVIEGFLHPRFDMYAAVPGSYIPSFIELSAILGTLAMVTLFFMVIAKVIPVVELHAIEDDASVADWEVEP